MAAAGLTAAGLIVGAAPAHGTIPSPRTALGLRPASSPAPSVVTAAGVSFVQTWKATTGPIVGSSPIADTFGGTPAVVVGSRNGKVYALTLAHGAHIAGWPVTVPGAYPVDSTPSVNGTIVYVGTGDVADSRVGGYLALNANGSRRWYRTVATTPGSSSVSAVSAGITFGVLQGHRAVVGGSLGEYLDELSSNTGATLAGFPWFSADSTFSTAAVADLYGSGKDYIVEGGDSTAGVAMGTTYTSGGHIRVLLPTGNAGTGTQGGGLICSYNPTQGVESSPAVGGFLRDGAVGIVAGTGIVYPSPSDNDKVIAVTSHCGLAWKASLDGTTGDSPALVDALGDGHLQVAEGTDEPHGGGTVYLLAGSTGQVIWSHAVGGAVLGSIVSASLNGRYQDLLVPTTTGLYVLDGQTGHEVALLGHGQVALQSAPLVTDDPGGHLGITVAGSAGSGGVVIHWDLSGTKGSLVDETGAWPMFHHDNHLSGTTLRPGTR